MSAAVTVTRLSSGQRPRNGRCTRPRSISVIGWATRSPGFGGGEDPLEPSGVASREPSSPNETGQRRGHRYSRCGHPIDYLDRRGVDYLDRSQHSSRKYSGRLITAADDLVRLDYTPVPRPEASDLPIETSLRFFP